MHTNEQPTKQQNQQEAAKVVPIRGTDLLRDRLHETMAARRIGQRRIAKEIGIAQGALSTWLNGSYKGSDQAVAAKVGGWLARQQHERSEEFVRTPTSQRILSVFENSRESRLMSCIYGGAGLGKTTTIAHYCSRYPGHAWHATIDPSCSAVVPALDVIAEAVGVDVQGGALWISRAICRHVAQSPGGVLIVDEAQHLSVAAIEAIRAIHDKTRIGLVLCGNLHSYKRLAGAGFAAERFAQVNSRIGLREFLHRLSPGDVEAIASAWGVVDQQVIDLLKQIASSPGALRSVALILRWCSKLEGPTTVDSIYAAAKVLGAEV